MVNLREPIILAHSYKILRKHQTALHESRQIHQPVCSTPRMTMTNDSERRVVILCPASSGF